MSNRRKPQRPRRPDQVEALFEPNPFFERMKEDELLTIQQASDILLAPVSTLRYWRHLGTGPHSFRVGRCVRYWRRDIMEWLAKQTETSSVSG